MSQTLINIGDLGVIRAGTIPEGMTAWAGERLMGNERVAALAAFKHSCATLPSVLHNTRNPHWADATHQGKPRSAYTFWHMPYSGPCREISAEDVDWGTSSVDSYVFDLPNYLEYSRHAADRN